MDRLAPIIIFLEFQTGDNLADGFQVNVIGKDDLVSETNPDGHYVFIPALTNENYPDNKPTVSKRQSFHDYYAVTIDCENPKLADAVGVFKIEVDEYTCKQHA